MEIYSDLSSAASKEFEQLLNSHQSKTPIEEGKIIEGKINKITDKTVPMNLVNASVTCTFARGMNLFACGHF